MYYLVYYLVAAAREPMLRVNTEFKILSATVVLQ